MPIASPKITHTEYISNSYQLIETASVILLVLSFATVYTRWSGMNYGLYLNVVLNLVLLLLASCALYRLQKAQQSFIPIIRFIWLYYLAFLIPFHILNSFNYPINLTFLFQLSLLPLLFPYFYDCFLFQRHYQWLEKFVKLMKFLAVISLFFWLFGSLLHLIPPTGTIILDWGPIRAIPNYYLVYFETQTATIGSLVYPRNSGIFTEAPMFAAALSLAFITEYCLTKTTKTTIVLVLALLSTGSYTALLILLLVGSHCGLRKIWQQIKQFNLTNYLGLVMFSLFILTGLGFVAYAKLFNGANSVSVRWDDYVAGIHAWSTHPFVGVGIANFTALQNEMAASRFTIDTNVGYSNGIIRVLAAGGIYLFSVYLLPLISFSRYQETGTRAKLFTTLILLLLLLTIINDYTLLLLILLMMFTYAWLNKHAHGGV